MYFIENGKPITAFAENSKTSNGIFTPGVAGVEKLYRSNDNKIEMICYSDKTLCGIYSTFSHPAIYPWITPKFEGPAKAVLMDLDGTSVHSEEFWMWIIEQVIKKITDKNHFEFENTDEPYISGHSVSEHLQYAIDKYCPDKSIESARELYYKITEFEMNEIMEGRGRKGAFTPAPGLKEFLNTLKRHNIQIGLVTSGLYQKAFPEIISAFNTLDMGDPLSFYDAIITAGSRSIKGCSGNLSETCVKPHPWLYSEIANISLGIRDQSKVVGIEDSGAGVIALRLAGYDVIGMEGGNIRKSGLENACSSIRDNLCDLLDHIIK